MLSAKDTNVIESIFNSQDGAIVLAPLMERDRGVDSELERKITQLELDGVSFAKLSNLEDAMECFSRAIDLDPSYGSVYNNRAQVLRLMNRNEAALADIEKAIEFGSTKVLGLAFTQRAVIKREQGDLLGADQDFSEGAQYGNAIAKGIVKANPYALLCNRVVVDAMRMLG